MCEARVPWQETAVPGVSPSQNGPWFWTAHPDYRLILQGSRIEKVQQVSVCSLMPGTETITSWNDFKIRQDAGNTGGGKD